jgi:NADH dehydrogenase FAD-containing subunit
VTVQGTDIYPVKPIESLIDAQKRLLELFSQEKITVGIVGGGPAALEIAGNTWRLARGYAKNMPRIRLFAGKNFVSRFPPTIRKKAATSVTKRGIEILERGYVQEIRNGKIILESGESHTTNFVFLAIGVKPSPIFEESGLPIGPDGGLLVNEYLQSTEYPEIFGGGDCIYFKARPLDKVGVYAVRQNPVLYHNLMASLEGTALESFEPQVDYLLILNMGDGTGIFFKKCLKFSGRLAFMIKDYIDRKFMKRFQSIE